MKMRNVQTLLNYYQKYSVPPPLFSLGFAAYLLFMRAVQEREGKYYGERNGQIYPINDQSAEYFYQKWQGFSEENSETFVTEILSDNSLWGTDLSRLPDFAATVSRHLMNLRRRGAVQTLQGYLHAAL
jgi:tagaturonate reductase